jgi:hypothetical protein
MSVRNRFLSLLAASACTVVLVTACAEMPSTSSPSAVAPTSGPSFGYLKPYQCDAVSATNCTGETGDGLVREEQLEVCKYYPAGTVNPPAVTIQLEVKSDNVPRSQQSGLSFTLQPNSCLVLWQNGEDFGPNVDTVWVTEVVPAGYTATSQVTTRKRFGPRGQVGTYFANNVEAPTTATTVKGYIGGYEVPGLLVDFTNTKIETPPPPAGCTLTQGYWKTHEDKWPAGYSPTDSWMVAGHVVTGLTWDGLFDVSPKGGNSYVQLAHQWMAATLNKASGASVPGSVQSTIDAAGAWLLANTPVAGALPTIKDGTANGYASVLDGYNNGLTGPGHCTD